MSTQAWHMATGDPDLPDVSCDLDGTPSRQVRHLVGDLLADRDGVTADDAVLVTDELVTNAHRHGLAPRTCRVTLTNQGRCLRVEVDDASPAQPRLRTPDRYGGRGLVLVNRLSSSWGVRNDVHHKTVWAELVLDHAGSTGHVRHLSAAPNEHRPGGS